MRIRAMQSIFLKKEYYSRGSDTLTYKCNIHDYEMTFKCLKNWNTNKVNFVCKHCQQELTDKITSSKNKTFEIGSLSPVGIDQMSHSLKSKFDQQNKWTPIYFINTRNDMAVQCNSCGKIKTIRPNVLFQEKNNNCSCHTFEQELSDKSKQVEPTAVPKNVNNEYLTEQNLSYYLSKLYPGYIFHNHVSFTKENTRFKVDYFCQELKLIIEFDGLLHYTDVTQIERDARKDALAKKENMTLIRIPYFVQMTPNVIKDLFNKCYDFKVSYPHGFIDKKVCFPSNYCYAGIQRFKGDLDRFSYIKSDIIDSLRRKIKDVKSQDLIIPDCLNYLLEE